MAEPVLESQGQTLVCRSPWSLVNISTEAGKAIRAPQGSGLHSVWGEIQPHLPGVQLWLGYQPDILSKYICTPPSPSKLIPCWAVPLSSLDFLQLQQTDDTHYSTLKLLLVDKGFSSSGRSVKQNSPSLDQNK